MNPGRQAHLSQPTFQSMLSQSYKKVNNASASYYMPASHRQITLLCCPDFLHAGRAVEWSPNKIYCDKFVHGHTKVQLRASFVILSDVEGEELIMIGFVDFEANMYHDSHLAPRNYQHLYQLL